MRPRDLLELVTLAALWGGSFLFMRAAVPDFGPIAMIAVRVSVAAAFLLPLLALRGGGLAALRAHGRPIALVGLTNTALPFCLFAFAAGTLTAGMNAILNATSPLWGALIARLWLGERLDGPRILGLVLGFAGIVVLVWDRLTFAPGGALPAIGAALAGSLSYGFSANYAKRALGGAEPMSVATGSQVAASAFLALPVGFAWPAHAIPLASWLAVVVMGVACTGIAYVLFFRLIAHVGPSKAIAVTFLVPVFGTLWGALFLDEAVTPRMLVGGAVVLAGTALATGAIGRRAVRTPA
jgi:drug/metabolite transporter (DMT)-like permease